MITREKFSDRGKIRKLEARYIQRVLEEEGQNMLQEQTRRIDQYHAIKSGDMKRERFSKSKESGALGAELNMSFKKYLRFNDMKRRRLKAALEDGPRKRSTAIYRKHYPLYNSVMYGHLSEIIKRVAHGFSDEVVRELQQEHDL